jgi:AcrR family transcriptional regulator
MPSRPGTRDRLLTSAGALFYDRGIAATGVDTIVQASGVSKPTLYAHFGSKGELVAAVLEQRHAERAAELGAWIEGVGDPRQRPVAVFAWLADWYSRAGERGCGFLNAAAELPEPDDLARTVVRREKLWFLDFLTRLTREAGLHEPEQLASQLLLLIDGVGGRVLVWGPEAAVEAVAEATRGAGVLIAAADGGRAR